MPPLAPFLILLGAFLTVQGAFGQPLRGFVWTPPEDAGLAEADLRRLHTSGARALRTPILRDEGLLTLADTLGLRLFQELPIEYAPARTLRRRVQPLAEVLDSALVRARRHPSARHFGLARFADTSDPDACDALQTLAERVRAAGLAGSQVYYVTAFIEDDQCARVVDLVLLDAREEPDPAGRLARWRAAHRTPVGLGALGTRVDTERATGWRIAHSPEAQARYLETHLARLLADTSAAPVALFVTRWRDAPEEGALPAAFRPSYGLLRLDGTARPALEVVQGFFTGRQTVFAFPAGDAGAPGQVWALLVAWGIIALLGVTYAASFRFRLMVPRYFRARDFYRSAVRDGRETLSGVSAALLTGVALSAGALVALALVAVREERAFLYAVNQLPEAVQVTMLGLLSQPWLMMAFVGSVYAIMLTLWAAGLALLSRRRAMLAPEQTLILVVWPRWPLLVLLLLALAATALPSALEQDVLLALLSLGILASLVAVGRTLGDYAAVTGSTLRQRLGALALNPLLLLVLAALFVVLESLPDLRFFWHLATRG